MSGSTFLLLLRLGLSLAIVMGLIWVAARILRARGGLAQFRQSGAAIDVVDRRPLSRSSSVALVRVGGRALLLGVTDSRVELIGEMPHLDAADDDAAVVVSSLGGPAPVADRSPAAGGALAPLVAARAEGARPSFLDALRDATVRRATNGRVTR